MLISGIYVMKTTMEDDKIKRFDELIDSILRTEKTTQLALAEKLGYTESSISRARNGKDPLSQKMLKTFKKHYPNINLDYIENGDGLMYASEPGSEYKTKSKAAIPASKQLPIFNIEEQNTALKLFIGKNKVDPSGYLSFPGSEFCDFAANVTNDALEPDIPKNSIVALKRLKDLNVIEYGESYLIHTADIVLFRIIRQDTRHPQKVILVSPNSKYDEWSIEREKIIDLFLIMKNIK